MQRGRVLKFSKGESIIRFFSENRLYISLGALFLISFLVSVVLCKTKGDIASNFLKNFTQFFTYRSDNSFLSILLKSFLGSMLFIALIFSFGTSMLGIIFVPIVFSLAGFLFGGFSAVLYLEYSLGGIAFWAILILPAATVFLIALLLATISALKFSYSLAKLCFYKERKFNVFNDFKSYCSGYSAVLVIVLLSAVIDAFLSTNFLKSFKF